MSLTGLACVLLMQGGVQAKIASNAVRQLAWKTVYNASYARLAYPGGDVPKDRGACTDVVIRALRPLGYDLQKLVHEDAKAHPSRYPAIQHLDPNIDHRRCPNLVAYFRAHGKSLSIKAPWRQWQAGEFVFWKLPGTNRDHVGVVSATRNPNGRPWVIHNIAGIAHEDAMERYRIVGRYRFP